MLLKIIHDYALQQGYSLAALDAAQEAHRRKCRLSHPKGTFDRGGRFTLGERHACCQRIRTPSVAYPHTEMLHGRSLTHMAHVHDVPKLHLRRLVRALDAARSLQAEADSNHAMVQLLVTLQYILKPVRPAHLGPDDVGLRNSPRDPRG